MSEARGCSQVDSPTIAPSPTYAPVSITLALPTRAPGPTYACAPTYTSAATSAFGSIAAVGWRNGPRGIGGRKRSQQRRERDARVLDHQQRFTRLGQYERGVDQDRRRSRVERCGEVAVVGGERQRIGSRFVDRRHAFDDDVSVADHAPADAGRQLLQRAEHSLSLRTRAWTRSRLLRDVQRLFRRRP